ncbi:MAG: hypothetical protein Q9208_005254 [Pyrenodesmia sp. 3 TL-2023]
MAPSSRLFSLLPNRPTPRILLSFSIPTLFATTMSTNPASSTPPAYPTTLFQPPPPGTPYPYTAASFTRLDNTPDADFYSTPRFVMHIDDAAIAGLRTYYHWNLPREGRVLDLCSSWVSHLPSSLEDLARKSAPVEVTGKEGGLEVVGLGMNKKELDANPVLKTRVLQDLNTTPELDGQVGRDLDATVCVVSIDYLTKPVEVLRSVLDRTKEGGKVHLVISNRCFPTKVVGRWLQVGESERLQMVAGYLWWAGWRGIEIVDVVEDDQKSNGDDGSAGGMMGRLRGWIGGGGGDPLWVVRGVKAGEGAGRDRKDEL